MGGSKENLSYSAKARNKRVKNTEMKHHLKKTENKLAAIRWNISYLKKCESFNYPSLTEGAYLHIKKNKLKRTNLKEWGFEYHS